MDVIAGFNPNNSNWNYNGYHDGDLTVVLPLGWNVRMTFTNHDADVPHSLVVMADVGPAKTAARGRARPGGVRPRLLQEPGAGPVGRRP